MGHIGYSRFFSQRLQIPLQIIADTEGRTCRTRKKECTRIGAIRKRCDPGSHLAFQIRRYRDKIVALIRLRVANPRIPFLTVLQSFVDSELRPLEIFYAQHENLGWPQAAYSENPQDEVFTRRCL